MTAVTIIGWVFMCLTIYLAVTIVAVWSVQTLRRRRKARRVYPETHDSDGGVERR